MAGRGVGTRGMRGIPPADPRRVPMAGLTLSELAERVDITLPNLSILKTNKARAIRFSTLDAICRELQCQPGDVLVRQDSDARKRSA